MTNKHQQIGLIFAFLLLITIPLLEMGFSLDQTPARKENRALASFPEYPKSINDLPQFLKGVELFFSDHFGFRNRLVSWNSKLKYFVFGVSPTNQVVLGKDGWLFSNLQNNFDLYQNKTPLTDVEISKYVGVIEERFNWSRSKNIKYLFVIAPDSHTINSEFLPDWATKINPGSRFDQIKEAMTARGIPFLDLRPRLAKAKLQFQVGYRTDTHWNSLGGFFATAEILDHWKITQSSAVFQRLGSTPPTKIFRQPGNDLAMTIGLQNEIFEDVQEISDSDAKEFKRTNLEGLSFRIENENGTGRFSCVCDSMVGNMLPFLNESFQHSTYFWGYTFDSNKIAQENPQWILNLVIERGLNQTWAWPANVME